MHGPAVFVDMDATVKPLRIPPEMAIYAEKHEIFDLLQVSSHRGTELKDFL